MTQRYETTRSRCEAPLMLIFPEGAWDILPFEVRLLRPWYGSEFCGQTGITMHQCSEIARRGYCIAAAQPFNLDKHSAGNEGDLLLTNPPELPQQRPSLNGRPATCHILIPILEQSPPSCPTAQIPELEGQRIEELLREGEPTQFKTRHPIREHVWREAPKIRATAWLSAEHRHGLARQGNVMIEAHMLGFAKSSKAL